MSMLVAGSGGAIPVELRYGKRMMQPSCHRVRFPPLFTAGFACQADRSSDGHNEQRAALCDRSTGKDRNTGSRRIISHDAVVAFLTDQAAFFAIVSPAM